MSRHLISGCDFRYAIRALAYINIICLPMSEILPMPLHYCIVQYTCSMLEAEFLGAEGGTCYVCGKGRFAVHSNVLV